ncbi:hypothetical protein D3C72_909600 [compost metagenome]
MYVGHFAIALGIKAVAPKVRAMPIILGAGFLDIIDGLLIIAGIDKVTANLNAGPYLFFDLTFIDWDHSLLMAIILSLLWGAFFLKNRQVAVIAAAACFSHFLADVPMHNADLALYPYAAQHLGFGLWGRLQTGAWVLEGVFAAVVLAWAWTRFKARGVSILWPVVVLIVAFLNLSPWASPMKLVAGLDEPAAHLLHGVLVTAGFLLPGLLLSWLVDRAEARAV